MNEDVKKGGRVHFTPLSWLAIGIGAVLVIFSIGAKIVKADEAVAMEASSPPPIVKVIEPVAPPADAEIGDEIGWFDQQIENIRSSWAEFRADQAASNKLIDAEVTIDPPVIDEVAIPSDTPYQYKVKVEIEKFTVAKAELAAKYDAEVAIFKVENDKMLVSAKVQYEAQVAELTEKHEANLAALKLVDGLNK